MLELEQGDDPQLIFESLNSTGLRLSESDKVRNYILMHITDPAQQQRWYEDYWQQIEGACTNADGSSALDAFLRDYLTARMSTIPRQDKIYAAFKEHCAGCGDRLEVLRVLHCYAGSYRILLQGGASPQLDDCIRRLNYLGTGVARPYLLEVLEMHRGGQLTDEELLGIFESVESFFVRRFVCGLPTNSLNKIFQVLHRQILREGEAGHAVYVDRFSYYLTSRCGSGRFPEDEEFSQAFTGIELRTARPQRIRYLLERLENARTREQHEIYGNDHYSIEHIMPQALNDEWRRALGTDCQAVHEQWLHRLANLTLTAYNSTYSNCSFVRKRDMQHGFRDSGLRLNSYLARLERWDEAALQARQRRLLEDALAIWPRPVSSYCPPRPPEDSMTLAEWDEAGGGGHLVCRRTPLRCILLEQELQATSWRHVLMDVVRMLYARDPAVIMDMIHGDHQDDDSVIINFSDKEHNEKRSRPYDRIDEGFYLYTGLSSWHIMRTLRLLLRNYQIDLSELIIFLKPMGQTSDESGEAAPQLQED